MNFFASRHCLFCRSKHFILIQDPPDSWFVICAHRLWVEDFEAHEKICGIVHRLDALIWTKEVKREQLP